MRVPGCFVALFFLTCSQVATADDANGDPAAGEVKAEACAACHNSRVSLKGRGEKTIIEQSKVIIEGQKKHPPGLATLSDDDLADIAAYLDGAD